MKGSKFMWTDEVESAFQLIKECITTAPILVLPDFSQPFELHTNAFKVGIRVVLSQNSRPVAFLVKNCLVRSLTVVLMMWSFIQ